MSIQPKLFVFSAFISSCAFASIASASISTASIESCVRFNPNSVLVQKINDEWKLQDGSKTIFSFGKEESSANQALKLVKTYQLAQLCSLGKPEATFTYFLTSTGAPPRGSLLRGEDCTFFSPDLVQIQFFPEQRSWKLLQQDLWLIDFGDKKQDAYEALALIKKYKFFQQCFIGRPFSTFSYWKGLQTELELPDLSSTGSLSIGKSRRAVKWNDSIVLTPEDAVEVINGIPAFDIFYSEKNFGAGSANLFENQLLLDGLLVSRASNRSSEPEALNEVQTKVFLKPSPGTHILTLKLDALGSVVESEEENNLFSVKLTFKGF